MQHAARHRGEHLGVAVVEIPLEGIEARQHPAAHVLVPGEVARRGRREHLRHGLLVAVGNGPVGIAEVVCLRLRIPRLGPHGPFMRVRRVVHHEVKAQADTGSAQRPRQRDQILIRAQRGIDRIKVLHSVAAIVLRMRHFQQRHQVQIGDAQLPEVGQPLHHAAQIAGEQLGVHRHAQHIRAAIPERIGLARPVQRAKLLLPACPRLAHHRLKAMQRVAVIIQLHKEPFQLVPMAGKAPLKLVDHP